MLLKHFPVSKKRKYALTKQNTKERKRLNVRPQLIWQLTLTFKGPNYKPQVLTTYKLKLTKNNIHPSSNKTQENDKIGCKYQLMEQRSRANKRDCNKYKINRKLHKGQLRTEHIKYSFQDDVRTGFSVQHTNDTFLLVNTNWQDNQQMTIKRQHTYANLQHTNDNFLDKMQVKICKISDK